MTIRRRLSSLAIAAFVMSLTMGAWSQVTIEPPAAPAQPAASQTPIAPAAPAAAASAVRASTLPSADSVLQGLLRDKPAASAVQPSGGAGIEAAGTPHVQAVAPNEPTAVRLREGQSVYNRVGRLVRDEKTGLMLFVFDADGAQMQDPPMGVIPCKLLAVMEDASEAGTKPVRFRISAEITQYRGKNFLYPHTMTTLRDLSQGLGQGFAPVGAGK